MGSLLRGWALAHQGQAQEGIEQITQGLSAFRATEAEQLRPYCLSLLAEMHGIRGEPEEGLALLTEALTLVDKTGERWDEAELHRLKGELLLQQYCGQNLGCLIGNDAIVTKRFVIRAGFFQTLPVG